MLCSSRAGRRIFFRRPRAGESAMSLGMILVIILIIFLHSGMGLGGVILIVLIILLLLGKL
jgi:hypothetical protein